MSAPMIDFGPSRQAQRLQFLGSILASGEKKWSFYQSRILRPIAASFEFFQMLLSYGYSFYCFAALSLSPIGNCLAHTISRYQFGQSYEAKRGARPCRQGSFQMISIARKLLLLRISCGFSYKTIQTTLHTLATYASFAPLHALYCAARTFVDERLYLGIRTIVKTQYAKRLILLLWNSRNRICTAKERPHALSQCGISQSTGQIFHLTNQQSSAFCNPQYLKA